MTSLGNHSCRAAVEANRLWWNGEWLRTFAGDFSTSPLVLWKRARGYPPAGNEESSRISRVLTADRGLPADEHQTPAALRGAVLIAAFLGTEMQHLPVHRARYAGSGGNISPAYGVLLQLPANHHVGPGRRRSLARHVAPGLEEAAKQRSQECEDQEGEEKIDDEVTQHGGGAGNCSPPRNSLTEPTFSSWRAKRWGSCPPCPPSCSSIPACLWRSRRIARWAPVAGTSGTPPPCPPPASLCHRPRTTPYPSDRLPTRNRNPHGSGPVRSPSCMPQCPGPFRHRTPRRSSRSRYSRARRQVAPTPPPAWDPVRWP